MNKRIKTINLFICLLAIVSNVSNQTFAKSLGEETITTNNGLVIKINTTINGTTFPSNTSSEDVVENTFNTTVNPSGNTKTFGEKMGTANKIWTIKFNNDVDKNTLSNSIIIEDAFKNIINTTLDTSGNTVKIKPPASGYDTGTYTIKILDSIKSSKGSKMKDSYDMKFNVPLPTKPTMYQQVVYAIGKYSPSSSYILGLASKKQKQTIEEEINFWLDDSISYSINTSVHETMHGFQSMGLYDFWNPDFKNSSHLIDNKLYIAPKSCDGIFKTEEATGNLPENLKPYRWQSYASPGSILDSNTKGIYGLLDEFEAYYYGDKAVYDCYGYFLEGSHSKEVWFDYIGSLDGTAFYEFSFFTLKYLTYSKQNHVDTYNTIMNDTKYKTVFKYIYNNYKKYVEIERPARIKQLVIDLNKMGKKASYSNHNFYIDNIYIEDNIVNPKIQNIKKEMEKTEYVTILNELLK